MAQRTDSYERQQERRRAADTRATEARTRIARTQIAEQAEKRRQSAQRSRARQAGADRKARATVQAQRDAAAQARQTSSQQYATQRRIEVRRQQTRQGYTSAASNIQAPSFGGGASREGSARAIVVIIGLSVVATVAFQSLSQAPTKQTVTVNGETLSVPTHLRTVGGVFTVGVIALVVNEVNPGLGLALAILLGFDVALHTLTGTDGLFAHLGSGLFGGVSKPSTSTPVAGIGGAGTSAPTTPGGSQGVASPPVGPKVQQKTSTPWWQQTARGFEKLFQVVPGI